jgi:aspartate aminotransferase
MQISNRAKHAKAEGAFEVLAKAQRIERETGMKVVHMEIGEPDFPTPKGIIEACKKALDEGKTHYTPAGGIPEFRTAVAKHLSKTRNINVDPENVLIASGGKLLIYTTCVTFLEPGDECIVPDPGYPPYQSAVNLAGGIPIPLPLTEENGYQVTAEELEKRITPKTKLIIINTPQNPTGGVLSKVELEKIADVVKKSNAVVFSDEIYSDLIYSKEDQHFSIASIPGMLDRTVLMDGMSKTYSMTGWRLGYAAVPKEFYGSMKKIVNNTVSCCPAFTQIAGIHALEGDNPEVHMMWEHFKERRDIIFSLVNDIPGMSMIKPKGAFYAFVNVKPILEKYSLTSADLAEFFLQKAYVACLSGSIFGKQGDSYIRFSYATSKEDIQKGMGRIKELIETEFPV